MNIVLWNDELLSICSTSLIKYNCYLIIKRRGRRVLHSWYQSSSVHRAIFYDFVKSLQAACVQTLSMYDSSNSYLTTSSEKKNGWRYKRPSNCGCLGVNDTNDGTGEWGVVGAIEPAGRSWQTLLAGKISQEPYAYFQRKVRSWGCSDFATRDW